MRVVSCCFSLGWHNVREEELVVSVFCFASLARFVLLLRLGNRGGWESSRSARGRRSIRACHGRCRPFVDAIVLRQPCQSGAVLGSLVLFIVMFWMHSTSAIE